MKFRPFLFLVSTDGFAGLRFADQTREPTVSPAQASKAKGLEFFDCSARLVNVDVFVLFTFRFAADILITGGGICSANQQYCVFRSNPVSPSSWNFHPNRMRR